MQAQKRLRAEREGGKLEMERLIKHSRAKCFSKSQFTTSEDALLRVVVHRGSSLSVDVQSQMEIVCIGRIERIDAIGNSTFFVTMGFRQHIMP